MRLRSALLALLVATGCADDDLYAMTAVGDDGPRPNEAEPEGLPNINMQIYANAIRESAYTQTLPFTDEACGYIEGCVQGVGDRRLLRFDTITPNDGEVDLEIGSPMDYPELFEWGACHEHYHYKDFAFYRLLAADSDEVVATGHKQAFALIDSVSIEPDPGPPKYPLPDGTQGISEGWADVYGHYLDCQWVDITGVEPGDYRLEISINPFMTFEEIRYDDNLIVVDVSIGEEDDGPPAVPAEWTCLDTYYADDDGCHCGCGVVDPDCLNPTAEACEVCEISGSCAQELGCEAILEGNNAVCG